MIATEVEGIGFQDDTVRLSTQVELTEINGTIVSDSGLSGYWLVVVWDRNADGRISNLDTPFWFRTVWVPIALGTLPAWLTGPDPVNLLAPPGFDAIVFPVPKGRRYMAFAVAVAWIQSERSALVNWGIPSLTGQPLLGGAEELPTLSDPARPTLNVNLGDLIGLTADGLASRGLSDYETVRFRVNRIDPPRR